jgi:hypothetical protein
MSEAFDLNRRATVYRIALEMSREQAMEATGEEREQIADDVAALERGLARVERERDEACAVAADAEEGADWRWAASE